MDSSYIVLAIVVFSFKQEIKPNAPIDNSYPANLLLTLLNLPHRQCSRLPVNQPQLPTIYGFVGLSVYVLIEIIAQNYVWIYVDIQNSNI